MEKKKTASSLDLPAVLAAIRARLASRTVCEPSCKGYRIMLQDDEQLSIKACLSCFWGCPDPLTDDELAILPAAEEALAKARTAYRAHQAERAKTAPQRRAAGVKRIAASMEHVQRSQIEMMLACSDLSAIIGYLPEWKRMSALHEQIKKLWYRLDSKRGSSTGEVGELDHEPSAVELEDGHQRGCGAGGRV